MKKSKNLFLVILLLGLSGLVKGADVSLVNFESPTAIGALANGSLWTGSSSSLYVGANPQTSGINTTAQAGYAIRTTSQGSTFQAEFNVLTQNYNGVKYFHIMVYKPKQSKMQLIGRQNSPTVSGNTWDNRFTAKAYYTDVENQWVDVVFKYDFTTTNLRIDRFVLSLDMIAPGTRYSGNTNIYFDEIIVNDDPQPRGRTVDYSAKQLPESFEGTSTIIEKSFFGIYNYWKNGGVNDETATETIVANPAKNNVNETNNVLRMMYRSSFWWDSWLQVELNQGAGMTVGASNKYLHIMMYKNADAQFAVTTRVGSSESGWLRTTTNNTSPDYAKANGWQDLVIEIPSANYGLINRLSINGHTTGPGASDLPVYIDEIEFSSSATPRTIFNVAKTYDFGAQAVNGTYTYSLPITAGALLNGDLTVSMSGSSDFSTTSTTLTQAQVTAGTTINLTYIPTTLGAKTGTLSIMSNGVTLAQVGIAGVGGDPNEVIDIDFESGSFFATTPANTMNGGVDDALTIVDNPSKTGLNTSNKVAMGVRSAAGTSTFQAEFNIEPTVINTTRNLHVYVYKPTHASMTLYGRNNYPLSGSSSDNVYTANHMYYTKQTNEWVDVVFKITGNGNKIDRLILGLDNFSPTGRYASNSNFYFDQILLNDDPNPRGATLPTKKTTFPEDFEGTSYVGDPTYFPTTYSWITNSTHANSAIAYESVVANPLVSSVNNSSKAFKTTQTATNSTWWTRIQFELNNGLGTIVGAGNKYFHVMMYKAGSGGEVKAFFIRTDNAQQEWINPSAVYAYAGWQDMVFEVPAAVYGDIKKVAILPHGGNATDVDVYFDNIEFSASSTPRTSIATSATNYFRSVGSGSWDNLANWESSSDNSYWIPATALPTSQATAVDINPTTQITMPSGTTLAPVTVKAGGKLTLNNNVTLNGVTLQSDATGTATFVDTNNDSPQSVTATVQQHLTAERNWYTASPIATGTASGLSLGTSVQTYSESSKGWTILGSSDALVAGKGYVSVATTGTGSAGTVSFSGVLNTGTIPVAVTRTGTDKAGFNLVANPYPSYLDWTLVTADPLNANIGTTIWFRTKTAANAYTFSTYNSTGNIAVANSAATNITKYIPPMQAFWIRVNSGTASTNLTFKNTMRSHRDVNGNTIKAPKQDSQKLLRLKVSNGLNSDETVLYFDANAQNSFDKYDSQKMFNNSSVQPEIYSVLGSEQLVINGLSNSALDSEQILGFHTGETSNFNISVSEMLNFEENTTVLLKDKLVNNEIELTENSVYQFSSNSVKTTDRFSLIFKTAANATGLNLQNEQLSASVFVSPSNCIEIRCNKISNSNTLVAVFNLMGEVIYNAAILEGQHTVNQKLNAGVYLVSVSTNGKVITKRVIIQ